VSRNPEITTASLPEQRYLTRRAAQLRAIPTNRRTGRLGVNESQEAIAQEMTVSRSRRRALAELEWKRGQPSAS
jgi:hypothetical protein